MSLPLPLEPGTLLGEHYRLGSLINRGGFGAVYRGIDTSEGNRPCAIKETYDVTPASRRQSLMEAAVLFTVRNTHLPEVYDAFEANGRFYLVMQLIEGQNFLQLIRARQRPFSEQEVIQWLTPIMDVLQELHSRIPPIIHRDIKPGNIILTPAGTAVLVDFGITKLYDPNTNTQTIAKAASEGFSPLEQYIGQTSTTSDMYALAATMYYLLTTRVPPAAIERSFRDELIPPMRLNPALSPRIERVLLKALALKPEDRYRDMRAFTDDLQGRAGPNSASLPRTASRNVSAPTPPYNRNAGNIYPAQPSTPPPMYNSAPQQMYSGYYPPNPPMQTYPNPTTPPAGYNHPHNSGYPAAKSQPARAYQGPLPSAFGRGCLWGLLQGVASALILLVLLNANKTSIAVFLGLGIYALAGFATTRKGGGASRGIWAGIWAGIFSVIIFWMVFGIGYFSTHAASISLATGHTLYPADNTSVFANLLVLLANSASSPHFASTAASSISRVMREIGVFYIEGSVLAMLCGWIGGGFGRLLYTLQMKHS